MSLGRGGEEQGRVKDEPQVSGQVTEMGGRRNIIAKSAGLNMNFNDCETSYQLFNIGHFTFVKDKEKTQNGYSGSSL
jgi:hypothetical protein